MWANNCGQLWLVTHLIATGWWITLGALVLLSALHFTVVFVRHNYPARQRPPNEYWEYLLRKGVLVRQCLRSVGIAALVLASLTVFATGLESDCNASHRLTSLIKEQELVLWKLMAARDEHNEAWGNAMVAITSLSCEPIDPALATARSLRREEAIKTLSAAAKTAAGKDSR